MGNAGPPPPKAFIQWLQLAAANSDSDFERDLGLAYEQRPDDVRALWNIARDALRVDPSQASPQLLKIMGLPVNPKPARLMTMGTGSGTGAASRPVADTYG